MKNVPSTYVHFGVDNSETDHFDFPQIPFTGNKTGYDLCKIPMIETEEQKYALILFREASSSNNDHLAFLFFWQVLETEKGDDPIGWINKTYRQKRNRIRITNNDINRLSLKGKKLGNYLYDDCRNAISHIRRRKAGKTRLKLDTPEDNTRIVISTRVIKAFARFYIEDRLKLQKSMYLVRKRGKGFPVYVDEGYVKKHLCTLAYKKLPASQMRKKRLC